MTMFLIFLLAALALFSPVHSHMHLSYPPPYRAKENPHVTPEKANFDINSPIGSLANFPCKGYVGDFGTPLGASVATWPAGSSANFTVDGGAAHGGGSCQVALSYDKGTTFNVIASFIGGCPLEDRSTRFPFTIPSDAPTGDAILAWTWFNKVGNREAYGDCATVTIGEGKGGPAPAIPFTQRPALFVANLNNGCKVLEVKEAVFPNPGPDVVDKQSPGNSDSLQGSCGAVAAAPGGAPAPSASGGSTPPTSSSIVVPSTMVTVTSTKTSSASMTSSVASSTPISTPGGVFVTGPFIGTSTAMPSVSTSSPASTPTSSSPSTPATSAIPSATPSTGAPSTGAPSGAALIGPCSTEGQFHCMITMFQQCASGQWSVAQQVAPGTKCTPGLSMNLDIGFAKRQFFGLW